MRSNYQRREVLIDDLVVVGEGVGGDEVATPYLRAVDVELSRGEVEQSFEYEDAMLATGATIRSNDRLVGEQRRELGVVVRQLVPTGHGNCGEKKR